MFHMGRRRLLADLLRIGIEQDLADEDSPHRLTEESGVNITISVKSVPGTDSGFRQRADVYPTDRPEVDALMVTGWASMLSN